VSGSGPHPGRVDRLRSALGRRGPAAVLITHLPNVRWLCGFTGSAGSLLVAPREAVFFTDFRYRVQGAREVRHARRIEHIGGSTEAIAAAVRRSRVGRLGFEAERMTFSTHAALKRALPGVELVPLRDTVETLRAVKDAGEIAAMRRALVVSEKALASAASRLRGRTEVEVAEHLRRCIVDEGGEEESFPTIVASGPRGAQPHAVPSRNVIGGGKLVIIDYGVRFNGYCSDLTRTFTAGKWEKKAREIYRIVLEAQRAAISALGPGVKASLVDKAARSVIERAGYGEFFGHGTGHGVGLEVHEKPVLSPKSGDVLEPGMVVTVEPGIYLEHFGGVRIEDMLLVTKTGAENMSRRVPKLLDS
jgi:Xaa-Pro aminopeptidase